MDVIGDSISTIGLIERRPTDWWVARATSTAVNMTPATVKTRPTDQLFEHLYRHHQDSTVQLQILLRLFASHRIVPRVLQQL